MRGGRLAGAPARRAATWVALAALVCFSAWVRVGTALADPAFREGGSEGVLRSDPALLYYVLGRVLEHDGRLPPDFRDDERVEHPEGMDLAATLAVGQELVLARTRRVLSAELPLHVFCVWAMGLFASLAALGVYGAARELSGSRALGLGAALVWALLPASYRTIGFVLVREDFSLPFYALHLWALARAARRGSRGAAIAAGALAALALSTWHAMSFVLALEVAALWCAFLVRGCAAPAARGAPAALAILVLACLFVPVLRASATLASPPMLALLALFAAPPLARAARMERRALGLLLLALLLGAAWAWRARPGAPPGDFAHVAGVLFAKLRFLGTPPADPLELSFDARLLWQGPFATLTPRAALELFLLALPLAPAALAWHLARARTTATSAAVAAWLALALLASFAVLRMSALAALAIPIAAAPALRALLARAQARSARERAAGTRTLGGLAARLALPSLGLALVLQAAGFAAWRGRAALVWHGSPARRAEVRELMRALPRHLPPGEALLTDFMIGPAVLAHLGHPIALQPKWERAASRERVEAFWRAFYHGSPQELRLLARGRFRSRFLLVDRSTMWTLRASRYTAGLAADAAAPPPGSAAAALLAAEPRAPGYRVAWSSTPRSPGEPATFRLFELAP